MKRRLPVLVLLLILGSGLAAWAQAFPLGLIPSSPESDEPLSAYVWTTESSFDVGDHITIWMRVSRASFVYLFDLQPDGIVRVLFPNAFSPNNYLFEGEYALPDGGYDLVVHPPTGVEELLIVATEIPLPIPPATPEEPFAFFTGSPESAVAMLIDLLTAPEPDPAWGIGWHAIYIQGDPGEPEPPAEITLPAFPLEPPFSASPGDAWHEAGGWHYGVPSEGWYWYFGLDMRWHLCWQRGI